MRIAGLADKGLTSFCARAARRRKAVVTAVAVRWLAASKGKRSSGGVSVMLNSSWDSICEGIVVVFLGMVLGRIGSSGST